MALELDDKDMMVIRFLIILLKKDNFRNHLLDCSDAKPNY